jgi:rhodanese-related sulfurtransferase
MFKYPRRMLKLFYRLAKKYEWSEITVDELKDEIDSNNPLLVIDLRSTKEFNGLIGHIADAKHIPIRELKSKMGELQSFKEKLIVTYCPGGGLSLIAVDLLVEADFENVKSLHGGLDMWIEKGYPVVVEKNTD